MKVACFSVAAMDYFPEQEAFFAGGNALNQAIRFRMLDWESAFVGAIGTDTAGDRIEMLFNQWGVDVSHMYRLRGTTASNEIVNDKEGERFGVEGAWDNGVYYDFLFSEADWAFVDTFDVWSTHANGRNYAEALKRKSSKHFLAVDFLNFDTYELLIAGKDAIDIAYFGGTSEQLADLIRMSKDFKGIIVLTLGAKGSVAICNGETIVQEALPVQRVVDTTGCGDAFQSGFTAEYVLTRDIKASLLRGSESGRAAAGQFGGVPWHSDMSC